jgi:ElaB/YqjD/DUF883 family membrane-anchored ribosome-binding protein
MTTQQANERLVGDLRAAGRDAEELLEATAGQAGEKAGEARGRLAAAVEAARVACLKLEETTAAAAKATDRCIREHPYETIGVAFGLGLLIGVLASRK